MSLSVFVIRFSSFVCCFICIVSMLSLFVLCFSLFCFDVRFLRFRFCFLCCQCVCCWVGEKACFVSRTAFVCILLFLFDSIAVCFVSRTAFVCILLSSALSGLIWGRACCRFCAYFGCVLLVFLVLLIRMA